MTYDDLEAMTGKEQLDKYLEMLPLVEHMQAQAETAARWLTGESEFKKITIGPETCQYECEWEENTSCGCHPEYAKRSSSGQFPTAWLALRDDELSAVIGAQKTAEAAAKKKKEEEERLAKVAREAKAAAAAQARRESEERLLFEQLKQKYELPKSTTGELQ